MNNREQKLRHGFTTGSCAAAAAKASAYMLLSGIKLETIKIPTPKGIDYEAELLEIECNDDFAKCAVQKDGGDDPDITTGLLIFAEARKNIKTGVTITGGEGIGMVTKPGLDQPVGEYAINSVPRQMIEGAVNEIIDLYEPEIGIDIIISAPGGDEVALHTFNPRLGIEGGISIIGTSGIVEPMSMDAIVETIKVELNQKRAEGHDAVAIAPGNYGVDFMKEEYDFDLDTSVKCSNFIGLTCDHVKTLGFKKMLFVGHAGKLVKIAGGIMNTHSREADSRMEIIAAAAVKENISPQVLIEILDSNTTEEAFGILKRENKIEEVSKRLIEKIVYYLDRRITSNIQIECIMFTKELGLLGETSGAKKLIEELKGSK